MYGDPMDNLPEVRELCLNCRYDDCFGQEGCAERQRLVADLRQKLFGDREKTHIDFDANYTINGVTMTGHEWIRSMGKKKTTMYMRVKHGCTFEEALLMKRKPAKVVRGYVYTINGETKTGAEWERALGLRKQYITQRARKKGMKRIDVLREAYSNHSKQACKNCDIKELSSENAE